MLTEVYLVTKNNEMSVKGLPHPNFPAVDNEYKSQDNRQ